VEPFDHETIRREQDRTRVPELIEVVMGASVDSEEWTDALDSLRLVEDYRAVEPFYEFLTDMARLSEARRLVGEGLLAFDNPLASPRWRTWWHSGDEVLRKYALNHMGGSDAAIVMAVAADDGHPLQDVAIRGLTWGFEESCYQDLKVASLFSDRVDVRNAAVRAVTWDEPLAAEPRLRELLFDPDLQIAEAAAYALQYYTSLATLAWLRSAKGRVPDSIEVQRAESESFIVDQISSELQRTSPPARARLRRWCEAIEFEPEPRPDTEAAATASAISVTNVRPRGFNPVADPAGFDDMLDTTTGSFLDKIERVRSIDWSAVPASNRPSIARRLAEHPDPDLRTQAARVLGEWNRGTELLTLLDDLNLGVRKSAMYHLREVDRSAAVAQRALVTVDELSGTAATEALATYVVHAERSEAIAELADRARNDGRFDIESQAVYQLAELGADDEIDALMPLLGNPPVVNWCVHIALLSSNERHRADRNHLLALVEVDYLDVAVGVARALGD
jgi:HEAT repeat protein